jgi:hypothetical protein
MRGKLVKEVWITLRFFLKKISFPQTRVIFKLETILGLLFIIGKTFDDWTMMTGKSLFFLSLFVNDPQVERERVFQVLGFV